MPEASIAANSLILAGKAPLDLTAFGTSGVSTLPQRVSLTMGNKQQTPASPGASVATAKLVRLGSGDPSLASSTSHLPVLQHRADSRTDLRQHQPQPQAVAVASSPAHRQRPELQAPAQGPPSPTHRTEFHIPVSAHAKGDAHQHSGQSAHAHARTSAQQALSKRDSWKEKEKELAHEADEQPPALSPSARVRTSFLNRHSTRESAGADASTAFATPRVVRRVMPASSASAEKTGTSAGGGVGIGFGSLRRAERPNSGLASNYNQRASRESLVQNNAAAAALKTAPRAPLPLPLQAAAAAAAVAAAVATPVALAHEELTFVDESANESSEPERPSRTQPQQQSQFRFPTSYAVPYDALAKYRLPSGSQTTNESTTSSSRNSGIHSSLVITVHLSICKSHYSVISGAHTRTHMYSYLLLYTSIKSVQKSTLNSILYSYIQLMLHSHTSTYMEYSMNTRTLSPTPSTDMLELGTHCTLLRICR